MADERSLGVHQEPAWCGVQPRKTLRALSPLSHTETAQATAAALPVSPRRRSPFHSTVPPGSRWMASKWK